MVTIVADSNLSAFGTGIALGVQLAIYAAIVRYRLYDLDRIISRTLAWGLLTLLLGGAYALVVLGLGQLLGRDSSLAVAAATLAAAALFHPARRRIQAVVDRRFNRRRPEDPGIQRAVARADRPGNLDRRAPGRGRPDHAANHGITVATSRPRWPAHEEDERATRLTQRSSEAASRVRPKATSFSR